MFFKILEELGSKIWAAITGLFTSLLGYFLPVKDIVHLIIIFFVADMVFGYIAARKLRGERFSTRIVWNTTIPRMVLSLVLILGAYAWDTVFNQELVSTYKIIGWFISGILLFSILQNGYRITRWEPFNSISDIFKNKLGVDDDYKKKNS